MKKLVTAIAMLGITVGLTGCGEKKAEAKQPEVQAPVASPVQASGSDKFSNFVAVAHNDNGNEILIDMNSIDKTTHRGWAKLKNRKTGQSDTVYWESDCAGRIKALSGSRTDKNGKFIKELPQSEWMASVPDSPLGIVSEHLCK